MTPGMAAATAIAAAFQAASDADQLAEEIAAEATYYANKEATDFKADQLPNVYVKPMGFASQRVDRSGNRNYEINVRVALRHKAEPGSLDQLFDQLIAIVDRDERFAGLAVMRVGIPETFAPSVYSENGVVCLDADVELAGQVTY